MTAEASTRKRRFATLFGLCVFLIATLIASFALNGQWSPKWLIIIAYAKMLLSVATAAAAIYAAYQDRLGNDARKKNGALYGAAMIGLVTIFVTALEGVNSAMAADASAKQAERSATQTLEMENKVAIILSKANLTVNDMSALQNKADALSMSMNKSFQEQQKTASQTVKNLSELQKKSDGLSRSMSSSLHDQRLTVKAISKNINQVAALNYEVDFNRLDLEPHVFDEDLKHDKQATECANRMLRVTSGRGYEFKEASEKDFEADKINVFGDYHKQVDGRSTLTPTNVEIGYDSIYFPSFVDQFLDVYVCDERSVQPEGGVSTSYLVNWDCRIRKDSSVSVGFENKEANLFKADLKYDIENCRHGTNYRSIRDYRNLVGKYCFIQRSKLVSLKTINGLRLPIKMNQELNISMIPIESSSSKYYVYRIIDVYQY